MADVKFRLMTLSDAEFYRRLMDMVGWGLTVDDMDRMLNYEPEGCFVASMEGRDVGMVASYFYGDFGWIGNLITLPEVRGREIGAALMRKAMGRLNDEGALSIRLDAVAKAIPLYERLEFKPEYRSLRFREISHCDAPSSASRMVAEDIEEIERLDERFFGADRGRMLRRVFQDFPRLCFVSREGGRVVGYVMAKKGYDTIRIGPWICDRRYPEKAVTLLDAIEKETIGERLWVGIPEGNTIAVDILRNRGFEELPSSLRMCYGRCDKVEDIRGIFGIGAAEKG